MRSIFIILCVLFMATQCEAPIDCTDPDCVGSPINFKLEANLSDTSSVFNIDDTLKMYIPIPDTIRTNMGDFVMESIEQKNTWFRIDMIVFDAIHSDGTVEAEQLVNNVKCLVNGKYKTGYMEFDASRRMAEIHFTFPRKGKYYISSNIQGGKFVFKSKDNDWMLAMLNIGLNVENQRHDLYLSWLPTYDQRLDMEEELRRRQEAGLFWYAFEVK